MTMQPPERASIGDLFCSRIPFQVPKYQRAFDLEKEEEIDDFIEDVLVLYEQSNELSRRAKTTLFWRLSKY